MTTGYKSRVANSWWYTGLLMCNHWGGRSWAIHCCTPRFYLTATTFYRIFPESVMKTRFTKQKISDLYSAPHHTIFAYIWQKRCLIAARMKIMTNWNLNAPLSYVNCKNRHLFLQPEALEVRLSRPRVFESCPATHDSDSDFSFDVEKKTHREGGERIK